MTPPSRFTSFELPLSGIRDDLLARMHAYWLSKCLGRPFPDRRDLDPAEFSWALGWVCLLDVERDPLRFRYRLEGSALSEEDGMRLTGKTTDEIRPAAYAAMVRRHLTEVAETGRPNLHQMEIDHDYRRVTYRRLALPLSRGGAEVAVILTVAPPVPDGRRFFDAALKTG